MEETREFAALTIMLPPKEDIKHRLPIWEAMHVFWLDTDYNLFLEQSARVCALSKYSMKELKSIFFKEVEPAFRFNLLDIAGEWVRFPQDEIKEIVLSNHRYGKVRSIGSLLVPMRETWKELSEAVEELRENDDQ